MLHAPAQGSQETTEPGHTRPAIERGEELHPHLAGALAPPRLGGAREGLPPAPGRQEFERLHHVYGNQAVLRLTNGSGPALQTKLSVNPVDLFEREAGTVADRVTRMTAPAAVGGPLWNDASGGVQRQCSSGNEGGECGDKEEKKEEKKSGLQRSPAGPVAVATVPPIVHEVLRAPGRPLDTATLGFMEPRFGRDFSHVRVHADSQAAESARSVNALAYTVGQNIVFDSGQYAPATPGGQRLLAHELTHVLQQESGIPAIQRQTKPPLNVAQTAADLEAQTCVSQDEPGAMQKLNALEMADLLRVAEKLYDNWVAIKAPDPMITMVSFGESYKGLGACSAWALLSIDLFLAPPTARTSAATMNVDVTRLKAAFDAARVHTQRNPQGQDKGTNPTHAGARDLSKLGQPARPGDWGEDAADNTWVMHEEGIRTYWKSSAAKKARSSQWLGKNVGNFGYNRGVAKRAIASFRWGPTDFRAIYLREEDSVADIRDNMRKYRTVGEYIDKGHLGPDDDRPTYYKNLMSRVPDLKLEDPPANWVGDDKKDDDKKHDDTKWNRLAAGFKFAEGWIEGTTVKANNVEEGAKPEDASLVAYYRTLLGVAAPATP